MYEMFAKHIAPVADEKPTRLYSLRNIDEAVRDLQDTARMSAVLTYEMDAVGLVCTVFMKYGETIEFKAVRA